MRARRFLVIAAILTSCLFQSQIVAQHSKDSALADSNSIRINGVEISTKSNARFNTKGMGLREILSEEEFKKAACCTLSESFELTNTVEVSNSDGVSGMKQIEILGLHSKYVGMSRENIPTAQGISAMNMLSNIPGPMVGGVHIAKGIGSVTGGWDGITGGLNFALKSDIHDPRVFLNAYSNNQGRNEFNAVVKSLGKRVLSHTYLHRGNQSITTDMGHDGYSDMPIYTRYVLGNHTQIPSKKWEMQVGGLFWTDNRTAGEVNHGEWGKILNGSNKFNFSLNEKHGDMYLKYGRFLNPDATRSLGNLLSISHHTIGSTVNSLINRKLNSEETRIHYSMLYQTPEKDETYTKSGIQFNGVNWSEQLNDSFGFRWDQRKTFLEIGGFHEWVMEGEHWNWAIGGRLDYHSIYGLFVTPRVHGKYEINPNNKINFQGGLGRRTPFLFTENIHQLVNNRSIVLPTDIRIINGFLPQEKAWNGGLSYFKNFLLNEYPATFVIDAFYTKFLSQLIVDRDLNLNQSIIRFNTDDKAGSNLSIQLDLNGYFHRRFSYRFSYRYLNGIGYYGDSMQLQPFQSKHRGIVFLQYQSRNHWYFDVVCQINGPKRLPYFSNPNLSATSAWFAGFSDPYAIFNLQMRKDWKNWEFYSGIENLLNVNQDFPILDIQGKFDAGYAWGPTNGRTAYFGVRWKLK